MLLHSALLVALFLAQDSLTPAARRVLDDVRYLSADARQGRGVGTAGLGDAARYIEAAFRTAGLTPAFPDGAFAQRFTIPSDAPVALHAKVGGQAVANIVAVVPGTSPRLRGQVVVIGAHYDHLGLGGFGSLDPDSTGSVHNGADDNASGTAALLEIGRRLVERRPARTIVLAAFTAEEVGVLGSTYFVRHPAPQPAESIYAMLNMDMVGRLRDGKLIASGAASAREFAALLDSLNASAGFDLHASGDGWGPSDHSSFYAAKRPVLHFYTDLHEDYHRATDDWDKINAPGIVRVAEFVADLAWTLANRPAPLTFVDVPPPRMAGGGGYGPYLGTIPDMTESPGGVRLTGVRSGGPAEAAGIQGGDIITRIGDHKVADLYDMTAALRERKAGGTVAIMVQRGDSLLTLSAVLGRRGS